MTDNVCLFQAANSIEANVIKGLLNGEGIEVVLQGEHLTGAMGELPPMDLTIAVWVHKLKFDVATTIVEHYQACQKSDGKGVDWVCNNCGETNSDNFEICWQCQFDPSEAVG